VTKTCRSIVVIDKGFHEYEVDLSGWKVKKRGGGVGEGLARRQLLQCLQKEVGNGGRAGRGARAATRCQGGSKRYIRSLEERTIMDEGDW
jgi:hypothetical protein